MAEKSKEKRLPHEHFNYEEEKMYNLHLQRIKHTKTHVETWAPMISAASVVKMKQTIQSILKFHGIYRSNFKLIKVLNSFIYKKRTLLKHSLRHNFISNSHNRAVKIQRENLDIAHWLYGIHHRNHVQELRKKAKVHKCRVGKFRLPTKILEKYHEHIKIPQDPCRQFKLFRPSIFLDVEALGERPIGPMTFQLYTEACPVIVLELVKFFMRRNGHKMKVARIFPHLWTELEIGLDSRSVSITDGIEYDMRALDNGSSVGIISFDLRRENLKLLRYGLLIVAISFKPIPVLNGRRVAIGRITNGRKNLLFLNEYGTKNGKLLKEIAVNELGFVDS